MPSIEEILKELEAQIEANIKAHGESTIKYGGDSVEHLTTDDEWDWPSQDTLVHDWFGIGGVFPTKAIEKKCECGSEKARVPGHATWCPKFEEEDG